MEKTFQRNQGCTSMAGIAAVYYVDINNVDNVLPKASGAKVALKSGHDWSQIESDEQKAVANYEDVMAWRHHVELLYHGNQQRVLADFVAMTQCRFLVKVLDNNNNEWLFGDVSTPLHFTFNTENDGEADGSTAYRLTFSALCVVPEQQIV